MKKYGKYNGNEENNGFTVGAGVLVAFSGGQKYCYFHQRYGLSYFKIIF
jgi:hypothetical protein